MEEKPFLRDVVKLNMREVPMCVCVRACVSFCERVFVCVYMCVLAKSLWKGLNLLLRYLISTHSNQSCPQEHSPELIREEGEVEMRGEKERPNMGERGKEGMEEI